MDYKVKEETLENIADAIRFKSNTEGDIQVEQFAQAILDLDTGENTTAAAESARESAASAASALSSATAASESAGHAAVSDINAASSAESASASALSATNSQTVSTKNKLDSEAWAVGTRDGVPVSKEDETYNNNAKYWASLANYLPLEDSDIQSAWEKVFGA